MPKPLATSFFFCSAPCITLYIHTTCLLLNTNFHSISLQNYINKKEFDEKELQRRNEAMENIKFLTKRRKKGIYLICDIKNTILNLFVNHFGCLNKCFFYICRRLCRGLHKQKAILASKAFSIFIRYYSLNGI
jgi:hypothetical protein